MDFILFHALFHHSLPPSFKNLLFSKNPQFKIHFKCIKNFLYKIGDFENFLVENQHFFIAFSGCFLGSAHANDHLRPKVWYENDRKNMENRFLHELKKC